MLQNRGRHAPQSDHGDQDPGKPLSSVWGLPQEPIGSGANLGIRADEPKTCSSAPTCRLLLAKLSTNSRTQGLLTIRHSEHCSFCMQDAIIVMHRGNLKPVLQRMCLSSFHELLTSVAGALLLKDCSCFHHPRSRTETPRSLNPNPEALSPKH